MDDVKDFRFFLTREILIRQQENPKYSLREFSREMNMSPQRLHGVLSGKSGISLEKAKELSEILKLSSNEKEIFIASAGAKHSRSHLFRDHSQKRLEELKSNSVAKDNHAGVDQKIAPAHKNKILEIKSLSFSTESKDVHKVRQMLEKFILQLEHDLEKKSGDGLLIYNLIFQ